MKTRKWQTKKESPRRQRDSLPIADKILLLAIVFIGSCWLGLSVIEGSFTKGFSYQGPLGEAGLWNSLGEKD